MLADSADDLAAMWRENSEELGRSMPWPADRMRDLVGYLERARQA